MSRAERFEDLEVWQLARELTGRLYSITRKPGFPDPTLRDQLRRAAVSIVANIAEGFERRSDREFIQFLYHTRGSAGELRSLLYVALDQHSISPEQFSDLADMTEKISKMLFGLIRYLRGGFLDQG